LDLISLEGESRAHELKLFPKPSGFFIQVERGVSNVFCFLVVLTSFPPASQLKSDTCGMISNSIGPSIQGKVLTSGSRIRTLGINTLIVYGSPRKLRVLLEFDTCDEDVRHVFVHGGNRRLVVVVDVGGRFRVSATGQSFGAFDLGPEVTAQECFCGCFRECVRERRRGEPDS
jgi:hypothetical protein